jgi:8-oxo-dGTP pyrophosphatase MutT (NUDIX family)
MEDPKILKWKLLASEPGPELPLFDTEFRHMENPRNGHILKAIVLHAPHTVNIIAVTSQMEWILVEQFRFGLDRSLVELPAGLMDRDETPLQAAKRELLEETGFAAENWTLLGQSHINPAYVTNCCYHFLALNAWQVGETLPDESEDLKVHLEKIKQLEDLTCTDRLTDAVGVAAVWYLQKYLTQRSKHG